MAETWFATSQPAENADGSPHAADGSPYTLLMARGWESKSVEQQQAAAATTTESKQRLTAEQLARKQQAESLQLCRKRILQQLEVAPHPAYRRSLEQALASLDEKLARLV